MTLPTMAHLYSLPALLSSLGIYEMGSKRCIKEAKETRFFLRMIVASEPSLATESRALYREATELIRILGSMVRE